MTQFSCKGTVAVNSAAVAASASVTVSPASAQLIIGGTMQFAATVNNASDTTIDWQVNGLPGGDPTVGNIVATEANTASYTAPTGIPNPATVTVRAVLRSDPTKFGSANVTVTPLPPPTLSIAPLSPSVTVGDLLNFAATVQNSNSGVIWQVNSVAGGNPAIGTISSSGAAAAIYKAPSAVPGVPITVTAVLLADPTTTSSTTVTVTAAALVVSVSVTPQTASVGVNQAVQFAATVQNSNSGLTWQVNGVAGGNNTFGTIGSTGPLTAKYIAPSTIQNAGSVTVSAVLQSDSTISGSAVVTISNGLSGVFSWRNDSSLSGQNQQEAILTPTAVAGGGFGKRFACSVDGYVYAQPLYASNVFIPGSGIHNVVYVATENDSVYAFDADANPCQQLWHTSFLSATVGPGCQSPNDCLLSFDTTNLGPQVGITGTPVIDPQTATLYVAAETKESTRWVHRLHALSMVTGLDVTQPAVIQAAISRGGGTVSFDPQHANQRAALQLPRDSTGKAYVLIAYGGYNDADADHGWLFAYDSATLQQVAAFNTTPDAGNGGNGGIWQSGAAPAVDANGNVFVASGDGTFDANGGSLPNDDYAESLLRLQLDTNSATFDVKDSFTPFDFFVASQTEEFGSTGVLLLPDSAGSAAHSHLAIAGRKDGKLYLVDRDQLGGFTRGSDHVVQTLCVNSGSASGGIYGTPAFSQATNAVYVAGAYDQLKAFPLTGGAFAAQASCPTLAGPNSQSAEQFAFPGATPTVTSNGSAGAIVWVLDNSGFGSSLPAVLHAYDASNLANELYSSPASAQDTNAAGGAVKFTVPTAANGKVYVGTQTELSVFGLP